MNIKQYQSAAMRTNSPHFNGKLVSYYEFMRLMEHGFALGDHARVMKKTLVTDPQRLKDQGLLRDAFTPLPPDMLCDWQKFFPSSDIAHAVLGILNETGEICGAVLKSLRNNETVDLVNMDEEVGDILWFLNLYATASGTRLDMLMEKNISKLRVRFPHKFDSEANHTRDLSAERKTLLRNAADRRDKFILFVSKIEDGWIARWDVNQLEGRGKNSEEAVSVLMAADKQAQDKDREEKERGAA